jgi:PadR family transcriptional regulator, regulatory protein PadR
LRSRRRVLKRMSATSLALIKGTLDVLILKTLSWEPMHGYAISRWIQSRSAEVFVVEEGALYPALRRLESKGLIAGEWGTTDTGREAKVYALTTEGERALRSELRDWSRYVEAMTRVLTTPRARA